MASNHACVGRIIIPRYIRLDTFFLLSSVLRNACRVIDVSSEWRTFSNDNTSADRSRVGATEVSLTVASLSPLPSYSI